MKIIVAGCRDFHDYDFLKKAINKYIDGISEIVSGCANGVDRLGERFAENQQIPIKRFPADWNTHGTSAGPIRNRKMAEYADALIAFWDGKSKGTKNMIDTMRKLNKPVMVIQI